MATSLVMDIEPRFEKNLQKRPRRNPWQLRHQKPILSGDATASISPGLGMRGTVQGRMSLWKHYLSGAICFLRPTAAAILRVALEMGSLVTFFSRRIRV